MFTSRITNMMRRHISLFISICIFLSTFILLYRAGVTQVTDSNYSMMVSESILHHGTVRLDHYSICHYRHMPRDKIRDTDYHSVAERNNIRIYNGHLYYWFPPGTPILSIPFVGLFNMFGLSSVNADGSYNHYGEISIEKKLSAILMSLLAVVFYITARLLLNIPCSMWR